MAARDYRQQRFCTLLSTGEIRPCRFCRRGLSRRFQVQLFVAVAAASACSEQSAESRSRFSRRCGRSRSAACPGPHPPTFPPFSHQPTLSITITSTTENPPAFLVHALTDRLRSLPDLQLRPHRKQRHQKNRKTHLHQRASFLSNNNNIYKTTAHECVRAHQRTPTALYLLFTLSDVLVDGPLSERPSPSPSPAATRQDDQHAASMPDDRVAVPHANLAATSSDPSAPPYPHPRPSSSFSLDLPTLRPAPALLVDGRWSPPSPSAAHLLEPACSERHF